MQAETEVDNTDQIASWPLRLARGLAATLCLSLIFIGSGAVRAEPLAKDLFGGQNLPALGAPAAHGFYSKGCFSGGVAIANDGPAWQAMRPSRNRRWGHPELVATVEQLAINAQQDGWNGLLVGDISQPRGGPMLTGHASHQLGLDADIWFTPMPNRKLTPAERENTSAISMLKGDSLYVDDAKWTKAHERVLYQAAQFPNVERLLVHPGIKKKLCDTVKGDRTWLNKVRPFWGHHYHFHLRIGCPKGSNGCKQQASTGSGDGCDKSLAWWFTDEPWRPAAPGTVPKPKARDIMKLSSLPTACRSVLNAPSPNSEAEVTGVRFRLANAAAPSQSAFPAAPQASASQVQNSLGFTALPQSGVPFPSPRP